MFGIIIFFVMLGLILWFLRSYGLKYYERIENQTSENTSKQAPTQKVKIEVADNELVPAIIAAVAATLYTKVKVKKISFVSPNKGAEWSHSGRIQNMTSHYMNPPKTYKY
jgi:hypothetical protein